MSDRKQPGWFYEQLQSDDEDCVPHYLVTDFGDIEALGSPVYSRRSFAATHLEFLKEKYPGLLPTRIESGKEWLSARKMPEDDPDEWNFSGDAMLMEFLEEWFLRREMDKKAANAVSKT